MSKSSVITTNKFAETKESNSQQNPNQNNLTQQQHQQEPQYQKIKQENKKEKHHNHNENLQEEKERNATTNNNNKTAKLQKINNHNKSDSSICCNNTIQLIEIESQSNDKLLSKYDHMIPYIDDDDAGCNEDDDDADPVTLEMGVGNELNQEHKLIQLTCHLKNEHARNDVVNVNYNDSSLSTNNNNNNKDSCYNNNKNLIMNSNLNNNVNCNKSNGVKADLNNCKISTSEQLKKQFMNVDVTKPNGLLRQTTLADIDDEDINRVRNATSGVQMKRNYINKQQQPFDSSNLVLNNGITKQTECKRKSLNKSSTSASTENSGVNTSSTETDANGGNNQNSGKVENLSFPRKLKMHENLMTTTNGAIIIKSCVKRIVINDKNNKNNNVNKHKVKIAASSECFDADNDADERFMKKSKNSNNKNNLNSLNGRTCYEQQQQSDGNEKMRNESKNNNVIFSDGNNGVGADVVDRCSGNKCETDPYVELEIYLEKVKKEISDVFEQLKITEKIEDSNNDIINRQEKNAEATIDQQLQHRKTRNTTSYVRSISNDDNKLIKQDNANGYDIKTINNNNNNKNNSNNNMNEINDACKMEKINNNIERIAISNVQQPTTSTNATTADHVQNFQLKNWNVDSMKEFDDLVEQEIKSLITKTEVQQKLEQQLQLKRQQQNSNTDISSLSSLSLSSTSISPSLSLSYTTTATTPQPNDRSIIKMDNQNNNKLEKHVSIPFANKSTSIFGVTTSTPINYVQYQENDCIDHKPPIDTTKKTKAMIKMDPVLKIEEDFDDVVAVREMSTQTSPLMSKLRNVHNTSSTLWTSDESIARGPENADEDNKSSSSSACEEVSAAMSSGKSGNSLDSTCEYDNIESGIGTATPPPDKDECWRKLSSLHSRRDSLLSNNWTRRENAMTQTNLTAIRPIKYFKSTSVNDDTDLLEVLSSYEGNGSDDDDFNDVDVNTESIDTLDHSKLTDLSFGTDSSSSTKLSLGNDELCDVVLRRKTYGTLQNSNDSMRQAISFPLNYLDKNNVHKSFCNASTNSLPMIKRRRRLNSNLKLKPFVVKERPYNLPLDQELFQHESTSVMDLPSPSSASLHNELGQLYVEELGVKCNSAPILLKKNLQIDDYEEPNILRYSRSQSDRYLAEIEATEACKWLRAAGFPQYAQMYEGMHELQETCYLQFPIDLSGVAKDHPFLENDPLQSLYRRLVALNRCATMRLDAQHKHGIVNNDDSDDETYALSENWTFQPQNRRWSRVCEMGPMTIAPSNHKSAPPSRESTPERMNPKTAGISLNLPLAPTAGEPDLNSKFRRTGSERLKDGAKAFLRRVESIKSRRRKKQNREGVIISGPQMLDLPHMNQKMTDLKCVDIYSKSNPSSPLPNSPVSSSGSNRHHFFNDFKNYQSSDGGMTPHLLSPSHFPKQKTTDHQLRTYQKSHSTRTSPLHFYSTKSGDDSSSYCSEGSQESSSGGGTIKKLTASNTSNKKPSRTRRFLQRTTRTEDKGTLSDSECGALARKKKFSKESQPTTTTTDLQVPKIVRGGSLNLGKESKKYREFFQNRSFRSKSAVRGENKQSGGDSDRDDDSGLTLRSNRSAVVRWHSFQSPEKPNSVNIRIPSLNARHFSKGTMLTTMSSGQLQIIRKLSLVTLTGYMERYCPTHRSGFNWELSRFIKIMKTPDYKDKKVFGIPLVLSLQRTGHTLPRSIQYALKWLRLNTMDQVGIFRKSGVKSRIAKLKSMIENGNEEKLSVFDAQQAYDVADMVKQYFRELPESLLTTKLSDTFIAIFHHLPEEVRPDAVQAAILLLPDEHREVLYILLEFLSSVSENAMFNQMTANNLAVCLAPSLFQNGVNSTRSSSVSPRRKRPTGIPDAKELAETRASHDCLTYLIQNYRTIYTISCEKISKCNFGCMEESRPRPLESLGDELQSNWCGYLYECTKATMREVKEKSRGWTPITSFDPACEISYKKVGDGHPLRLWRCKTEVEAPPLEVLHHILKERHLWDSQMLQWRVIKSLDEKSELFQYSCAGINVTDYCVVRSWQTDLPRAACVIVETSVEHTDAALLLGSVRGVVLASRYFIEPCGSGRSRVIHLARVDMKGRTPEWYNKNYGHICSHYLTKIRTFFKNNTEGPESKV